MDIPKEVWSSKHFQRLSVVPGFVKDTSGVHPGSVRGSRTKYDARRAGIAKGGKGEKSILSNHERVLALRIKRNKKYNPLMAPYETTKID